jgi:hypothetical protein
MKVQISTHSHLLMLTKETIEPQKCLFLLFCCDIKSMILHGFKVDKHAAHEYEGEHEEPEGGHRKIRKEHLHTH